MPFKEGHKKHGGRQKGTPNKASAKRADEIAKSGLTPLEFLINTMRNEDELYNVRLDAAKAAAPYIHPKLASVEHKGNAENPLQHIIGFGWMTQAEAKGRGWA